MNAMQTNPISFQDVILRLKLSIFNGNDPLLRWISRISNYGLWLVFISALVLYVLFVIGGGIIVSFIYTKKGAVFLTIFDIEGIIPTIFTSIVVAPTVWVFYAWQPRAIINTLNELYDNGVIGEMKKRGDSSDAQFTSNIFEKEYYFKIALMATFASLAVWLSSTWGNRSDPFLFGKMVGWWQIDKRFFFLIFVPFMFINIYMVSWMIIRQFCFIRFLSKIYDYFEIIPKIFHTDKCNGFSPIGDYAIRVSWIAILFGFLVSFFTIYPMFFGYGINIKIDTILQMIIYLAMIPVLLIPPVISTHKAMTEFKNKKLDEIAILIRELVKNRDEIISVNEKIHILEDIYYFLDRSYKTWPFRSISIKRFSISALLPIVTTSISYLIDIYTKN